MLSLRVFTLQFRYGPSEVSPICHESAQPGATSGILRHFYGDFHFWKRGMGLLRQGGIPLLALLREYTCVRSNDRKLWTGSPQHHVHVSVKVWSVVYILAHMTIGVKGPLFYLSGECGLAYIFGGRISFSSKRYITWQTLPTPWALYQSRSIFSVSY
jgi:hypothetical protein